MSDAGDFDAFYAATSRRVLHYVYAVSGDLVEAQDLTQEAYAETLNVDEREPIDANHP
jgi:RNA polymerase sigma-70 factor, ECF subfamily